MLFIRPLLGRTTPAAPRARLFFIFRVASIGGA
jgi:hypothetical protein